MAQQNVDQELFVDQYTLGLVGPDQEWAGTVADGGTIETYTPPGCWGRWSRPSSTAVTRSLDRSALRGVRRRRRRASHPGHVGDEHGDEHGFDGRAGGCVRRRPVRRSPLSGVWHRVARDDRRGHGEDAIKCAECGANASSFGFEYGYTVAFDDDHTVGITLDEDAAHELANDASEVMDIPENSRQHPILLYEPDEMPGTLGRLRPFIGNIGTTPPVTMPDSHNAGDFGQYLIGAEHDYGVESEADLEDRTDGHMDIPQVRPGATLICPVKVDGAGVYVGDLHANQGDGELSLHTTDVSGTVTMDVEVVKGLELDGPVLLPNEDELPFISKPYSDEEREAGRELGAEHGVNVEDDMAPIQVVGSGATVNDATQNAFDRATKLLDMSEGEVRSRCTFTGGVQIGRLPGVVQLDMLAPMDVLEDRGIDHLVRDQYDL